MSLKKFDGTVDKRNRDGNKMEKHLTYVYFRYFKWAKKKKEEIYISPTITAIKYWMCCVWIVCWTETSLFGTHRFDAGMDYKLGKPECLPIEWHNEHWKIHKENVNREHYIFL